MSEFTLIEASGGAKPKVVGVAYSGGKMNLPGWQHPVIVDLAGMEIPESVPLLTNHENKTDSRIGDRLRQQGCGRYHCAGQGRSGLAAEHRSGCEGMRAGQKLQDC